LLTSRGAATKSSSLSVVDNSEASCIIRLTAVDLRLTFGLDPEGGDALDILMMVDRVDKWVESDRVQCIDDPFVASIQFS
jgi:hypothetical protein